MGVRLRHHKSLKKEFRLLTVAASFGLPVSLGVGRSGISVCDPKVAAVFPEVLTIKLKTIVRDNGVRSSETRNDVFPNEFLGIHVPDVGQRFSLYPFGEIIGADYYTTYSLLL